ncbi:MAG: acyltransferase [Proteobacteria bacterium]|nr:MAG: acyltransferase [Pseudomonadota bacterium]
MKSRKFLHKMGVQPTQHRLVFLDSLRGIAALAVMFQHIGENLFDPVKYFTGQYLQLGQFGVTLFFLCSGFVIPFSLEKTKDLRAFWVNRVFRLYPLYWLVLATLLILFYLSLFALPDSFVSRLPLSAVVNLTMVQAFLGFEHASAVFWSLGFEMVFYVLVSIAFVAGILKRTSLFVYALLGLSVLNPIVTRIILHKAPHLGVSFHITTMFFGTLAYRWYAGALKTKSFQLAYILAFIAIVTINAIGLIGIETTDTGGVKSFVPMTMAWLGSYSLFALFLAARDFKHSGFAKRAGTISYSLYLIHPIVIALGLKTGSAPLTFVCWMAATWVLAELTFKFVEKPFIAVGKRLAHRPQKIPERQVW